MTTEQLPIAKIYEELQSLARIKAGLDAHRNELEQELSRRYSHALEEKFSAKQDPYGIAKLEDEGFVIMAKRAKKIAWDNNMLAKKATEIANMGLRVEDYLTVDYSIGETKFKLMDADKQRYFAEARTVAEGSTKIEIESKDTK